MNSTLTDQTITCQDCRTDFVWTAGQQEFYQQKQLSAPKRCKPCRDKRNAEKAKYGGSHQHRS